MTLKELFNKASELWKDGWLMQPTELSDVKSNSEGFFQNVKDIYYYVTVSGQPNFILEADPEEALKKAIEKWGDKEPGESLRKKKLLENLDWYGERIKLEVWREYDTMKYDKNPYSQCPVCKKWFHRGSSHIPYCSLTCSEKTQ